MSRYRGPGTLISSDGTEIDVHVDLRAKAGSRGEWSGTATIENFDTTDNDDRTLRLPNGREAQVTFGGAEGWSGVVTLIGSGTPPFP